jgi:hypothetical protein
MKRSIRYQISMRVDRRLPYQDHSPAGLFCARVFARLYPLERTLKAERQVCKLLPTLVPNEVGHAYRPCTLTRLIVKFAPVCSKRGWEQVIA